MLRFDGPFSVGTYYTLCTCLFSVYIHKHSALGPWSGKQNTPLLDWRGKRDNIILFLSVGAQFSVFINRKPNTVGREALQKLRCILLPGEVNISIGSMKKRVFFKNRKTVSKVSFFSIKTS